LAAIGSQNRLERKRFLLKVSQKCHAGKRGDGASPVLRAVEPRVSGDSASEFARVRGQKEFTMLAILATHRAMTNPRFATPVLFS
jgi:hypothetical protein